MPKTQRGNGKLFPECFAERLHIGKSAFKRYLCNRDICAVKLFSGRLQPSLYSILVWRNIMYLLKGAVKMKL